MTFRCGHPRTLENSASTGNKYHCCRLCKRVKAIVAKVERAQQRINAGIPLCGRAAAAAWL